MYVATYVTDVMSEYCCVLSVSVDEWNGRRVPEQPRTIPYESTTPRNIDNRYEELVARGTYPTCINCAILLFGGTHAAYKRQSSVQPYRFIYLSKNQPQDIQ